MYWVPSIAISGLAFYTGDRFPAWKGNAFVGVDVRRPDAAAPATSSGITFNERAGRFSASRS